MHTSSTRVERAEPMTSSRHRIRHQHSNIRGLVLAMSLGWAPATFASQPSSLQEAADITLINNAFIGAVLAHDGDNPDAFAAYFAADGEFRVDDPARPLRLVGPAAIREYQANLVARRAATRAAPQSNAVAAPNMSPAAGPVGHLIGNLHVKLLDAGHAKQWGYYAPWGNFVASGNVRLAPTGGYGSYTNEFVKINGRWLLKSYHVTFDRVTPE